MGHKRDMLKGMVYGLVVCATLTLSILILIMDPRPGIGEPDLAMAKIKQASTREEVFRLLGKPHIRSEDENGAEVWHYRCTWAAGQILSVYFRSDGQMDHAESWIQ